MSAIPRILLLLLALGCAAADTGLLHRERRGTRNYRDQCVDTDSPAARETGDTWLRWRGQRVEYCRCSFRGTRCHYIPVTTCHMSRCYNGGTCKEAVYSKDFICQCPPGFTGQQCEINLNEKCVTGQGSNYRGTWSISSSGAECINWNSTSLRGKKFTTRKVEAGTLGLGNHNYCRNPDGDSKPWCYVYKKSEIAWEFCSVPSCATAPASECVQRSGQTYRGTQAVSKSGMKCLPWDSAAVSRKMYTAWRPNARELGLGSHNFCRNPDGDLGPWCHIYKGSQLTWELCNITKCSRRPTITTLGPRAPMTTTSRGSCGQRSESLSALPTFRIWGGQFSDIKDQPWQAAVTVYFPRSKSHSFLCGGVLIDSCWVLSAAHCFNEQFTAERLRVVLGRTFRLQNSSSEQIFDVEKYWTHEQYSHEDFDNDIALLRLKSENGICAVNSPEVLPACLPEPGLVLPDWMECEISGYGKREEFSPFYSERVKRGYVRLWPQERCVPEKLSGRTITANMLCAGDTRGLDDACKGDSGGPLVCEKGGRMTLVGVISWGDGCGKEDTPGVYTRVTKYITWVSRKMRLS
ncbi:tissue-type plasminogen activator [Electrophorus electricus]|uniref:Plasminogen activator n=1 Tax=Electrophorus electricus TaxID=8005 RepID=A0A4W4E0B1_ELEEL|nr:tissue-type plasminogen activator [Electrophorus electricus]XP_026877979.2 tissue-type plasminogen activator [Electrophorus electricus]XP_026877981.2 tissue-type plasminogen activator [Electrophorus electricus]